MGLKGSEKKYLRGLVHDKHPVVIIGQKGVTPALIESMDQALVTHEVIKIKFVDFKEKTEKQEISNILVEETKSELVGMIGHTAIFYRQNEDPEKRQIKWPTRP